MGYVRYQFLKLSFIETKLQKIYVRKLTFTYF